MRVNFWGVRGTFPASGANFVRYGGDTMCIEVECGDARVVLDAGSGLRALGAKLNTQRAPSNTHIVLTHLHLDHVMGLPHFAPFWREDASISLHAPQADEDAGPTQVLLSIFRPPFFPICATTLPAEVTMAAYRLGDTLLINNDISIRTIAVRHQGACAGLIVTWRDRKLCYVTDHEHGDVQTDSALAEAVQDADLLIYDGTFTDSEMPEHRGWGHSSWEEGVRLKKRSGARLLALAHHDPDRTDSALDILGQAAAAQSQNVFFARGQMSLTL